MVWESATALIDAVAGTIGESDCEELHRGDLVQPVNALSSLAYVGVGIAIAVQALRTRYAVTRSLVYAACLSAVGFGSVMFHGPQPDGSRVMHDLPILLTVVFIVNHDLHLVLRRPRYELITFVAAGLAATVLTLVSLDAGIAATGVGVAAVAVLEFVVYRRHLRPIEAGRQRRAYTAIITIAAIAAASWLLGRTGSPTCDADGVFQFHGLWHAISSLVFGLWWWLALDHPSSTPTDDAAPEGRPRRGPAIGRLARVTRGSFEPVGRDRVIAKLASFIARAVYRDIEVHWSTPPQTSGPELTVANHFGGVADAILLLDTMPRPPGIIASDAIWKFPVVGWLMNLVGAIPVHKPEGGDTRSANDQMFATCYEALREGRHLLIFPEGVTRNEPNIAEVKTGAARIALGARAAGAAGIMITPVGIFYEDKAALRSRVVINVGVPIALDSAVDRYEEATGTATVTSDDRDAVGALTDEIERALRAAGPDYEDWAEARALTKGAEIALRGTLSDPRQPVPIALRDRLGNVLAERPAQQRADVCAAVSSYDRHLDGLGVTDADVYGRSGLFRFAASVVFQLGVALFILPFAIVGAIINFVPYLVVKGVGLRNVAASVHSTIKPIAAIVAFGITWGLVIWQTWSTFGIAGAGAAMVLLPIYLAATMLFLERMSLLWRTIGHHGRAGRVNPSSGDLETERAAVVEAVWAA